MSKKIIIKDSGQETRPGDNLQKKKKRKKKEKKKKKKEKRDLAI